ncbi:MAG: Gfo/Idh/MocA family protein [Vicinamibacterales bacterium]
MSTPVRVAVIGVGHLGRHHARILATLPSATLVGVVDIDRQRAEQVAAEHDTQPFGTWQDVQGRVDAVSVAVPTEAHLDVALSLIEQGVHVLVEKPMTRSVDEADRLIAEARARGVVLAVGHTERFNPAVAMARPLLQEPRFIEAHRLGTFPERSLDIDVVFDLMIHDLDIVLNLVGRDVASIEAVGVPVLTPRVDIANVRLRFEGGCIANLTASRISRDRVRKIRFFQRDVYVSIDYAAQEVEGWRLVRRDGQVPAIEGGKLEVVREEPLLREITDFIDAIVDRRPPQVTGEQGRGALALAARIAERMEENA